MSPTITNPSRAIFRAATALSILPNHTYRGRTGADRWVNNVTGDSPDKDTVGYLRDYTPWRPCLPTWGKLRQFQRWAIEDVSREYRRRRV